MGLSKPLSQRPYALHRAIAHNKVMVIGGHIVIAASFNFTQAAEASNAQNLLVTGTVRSNTPRRSFKVGTRQK